MKRKLLSSPTKLLIFFNPFSNKHANQLSASSYTEKIENEKKKMETIQTEPLRILDIQSADGRARSNSWVIVNQCDPKVFTNKNGMQRCSSYQKNAFVMQQSDAINCEQQLKRTGEKVALIRINMESWEWLMLVTEWLAGNSLIDS